MTYYEVLEVVETASEEVIRVAYKALAKKYHPDVYNGDMKFAEVQMQRINAAFEVLSNAEKRIEYDRFLAWQREEEKNRDEMKNSAAETKTPPPPKSASSASESEEKEIRDVFRMFGRAVVLVFMAIILLGGILNRSNDSDKNLSPVAEPRSGTILSGVEVSDQSYITVSASSEQACVVKLKKLSGEEKLSFYVRAGETVTVGVPYDFLYVYFASGETWYGTEELFGANTRYTKDADWNNFVSYPLSYKLYPVTDGNFSQTPVDADEFA